MSDTHLKMKIENTYREVGDGKKQTKKYMFPLQKANVICTVFLLSRLKGIMTEIVAYTVIKITMT